MTSLPRRHLPSLLLLLFAVSSPASGDDTPPPCDPNGNAREWTAAVRDTLGVAGATSPSRLGWFPADKEIVVSWHNWFPLDGTRKTLCGRFVRFEPFMPPLGITNERDWNVFVIPDPAFALLLEDARVLADARRPQVHECCSEARTPCPKGKRVFCLEAEVTPVNDFFQTPGASLPNAVSEGGTLPAICTHGPWVREAAHGSRPEIHPAELLWFAPAPETLRITIALDQSNRFDDEQHFWFGDGATNPPEGWHPWVAPTLGAKIRLAVLVPDAGRRDLVLRQVAPPPQAEAKQGELLDEDVAGHRVTVRAEGGVDGEPVASLQPVCRDAAGLHAFVVLESSGSRLHQTLEVGSAGAAKPATPSPSGGSERSAAIRPVPGSLRLADAGRSLLCDVDVIRPDGAGAANPPAGSEGCVRPADAPPEVVCRLRGIGVLDGVDRTLKMENGTRLHLKAPRTLLRMQLLELTKPAHGMATRRFKGLPWFTGEREDSPLAQFLNETLVSCWKDPGHCAIELRFSFVWEIDANAAEWSGLFDRADGMTYALQGKAPLEVLSRKDRFLQATVSLDGPRYARPYRGSRIPTDVETHAFRINEDPEEAATELVRKLLKNASLGPSRLDAILELSRSDSDNSLLGRRARMLRFAAMQTVVTSRHTGLPLELRQLAGLVAEADAASR